MKPRALFIAPIAGLLLAAVAVPTATAAPKPKPEKTLSFSASTYNATEGDGTVCVGVDRSVTKGGKAPTVTFATSDGTATAGGRWYEPTGGSGRIAMSHGGPLHE